MVSRRDKQCSNLTLQHMLSAAPRLLQLIPKQDLNAIFFTSGGLRQCVQECDTRCICFTATTTGLQSLCDQKWPPLFAQKLDICCAEDAEDLYGDLHPLAGAQWPQLAALDLSNVHLRADNIQILASAHLPSLTAVSLTGNELIEDAIKELVKASWPRLAMLTLSCQEYSHSSVASMVAAYLVKGEWPLLKTLDISCGYVCMGQLLNGKWPALEDLILLDMYDDEDAPLIVKETSGLTWPSLQHLSLSDGAVDELGIAELMLAEWPCLESVCLDSVSDEKLVKIFASCEWPALSCLELRYIGNVGKGALMCTRLSEVHLPVLETLGIVECCLDAAAIAELIKAAWKLLRDVRFSRVPIGAAGVAQLVQANWCNLHVLNISWCALSIEAVSELSKGQWPLLHSLILCETTESFWPTASVKRLLNGIWPMLSELVLSPSECEAAAFLLSGSTELLDAVPDSEYSPYPFNKVRQTVLGRGPNPWPCLKFSTFVIV